MAEKIINRTSIIAPLVTVWLIGLLVYGCSDANNNDQRRWVKGLAWPVVVYNEVK